MHKTTKNSLFTSALNGGGSTGKKTCIQHNAKDPEIKIYEIPPNSGGGDNQRGFQEKNPSGGGGEGEGKSGRELRAQCQEIKYGIRQVTIPST